jgi:hypothetical protein
MRMQRPRKVRAKPTRALRYVLISFASVCLLSVCLSILRVSVFLHTHARLHLSWGLCLTGTHTGW